MKVLVKQKRGSKEKFYTGVVVGKRAFERTSMSIFDEPKKTYVEDKLLIRMSDGSQIQQWESATFIKLNNQQGDVKQ